MSLDLIIHIESGRVINKVPVYKFFKELADGSYLAKFQPRKVRTNNQNAYYFAILPLILEGLKEAGFDDIRDKDDVHYLLKVMFLKRKVWNHQTGEVIGEISRSTTELSTTEFSEYLDRIGQWCAEYLGFELPAPNTQLKIV
jgi:hypothetical protein